MLSSIEALGAGCANVQAADRLWSWDFMLVCLLSLLLGKKTSMKTSSARLGAVLMLIACLHLLRTNDAAGGGGSRAPICNVQIPQGNFQRASE